MKFLATIAAVSAMRFATDSIMDESDLGDIAVFSHVDTYNRLKENSTTRDNRYIAPVDFEAESKPISEKLLEIGFVDGADAIEMETPVPIKEEWMKLSQLPTCDRYISVNCQPNCDESETRGCTEPRTTHGPDLGMQPDPYRFQGDNTNAKSVVS